MDMGEICEHVRHVEARECIYMGAAAPAAGGAARRLPIRLGSGPGGKEAVCSIEGGVEAELTAGAPGEGRYTKGLYFCHGGRM